MRIGFLQIKAKPLRAKKRGASSPFNTMSRFFFRKVFCREFFPRWRCRTIIARILVSIFLVVGLTSAPDAYADWWIETPSGYQDIGGRSRIGPYSNREDAEAVNEQYFHGAGTVTGSDMDDYEPIDNPNEDVGPLLPEFLDPFSWSFSWFKRDPEQAERALQQHIREAQECLSEGDLLWKEGQLKKSQSAYKKARKLDPQNQEAQERLARLVQEEATMREAVETARRLREERLKRLRKLQADLNHVSVPPPIRKEKISLSWKAIALDPESSDLVVRLGDWALLAGELTGKLGGKAAFGCNLIIIGGKTFIAGEDGARVYLIKQDSSYEDALAYLKNSYTKTEFVGIVKAIRQGQTPDSTDAGMLRAAHAITDPALSSKGNEILWDAMLSPEAKAAMVRKLFIETGLALAGHGLEGAMSDLSRQNEVYDVLRLDRRETLYMARDTTDPLVRAKCGKIISLDTKLLGQMYRLDDAKIKVEVEVVSEAIDAGFDEQKKLQENRNE